MATKATWKKYGIDMNDYTVEQRQTYDRAADLMLLCVSREQYCERFDPLIQARCANPVKTVDGVEYYQYWDDVVPACINTAIICRATEFDEFCAICED